MTEKIKFYFAKYREPIVYIIFGFLTTAVNAIAYFTCRKIFQLSVGYSTNVAWVLAVLFAYITNKIWVFESKSLEIKVVATELFSFVAARLLSWAVNYAVMVVGVDTLQINEILVYITANIIVILFNYFASKWFVFKKER